MNKKTKLDVIQSDEKLDGENVSDSESDSGMSDSEQSEESSDLNDAAGNQGKVHSDGPDDDVDKDDGSDVNDDDDNDSDDADDDDVNVNNDANESADDVDDDDPDDANEGGDDDDNDDDDDEDGNYEGDDLDDDSDAAGLKDSAKVDVQGKKEAKSDNIHRSNKSVSKRETPLSDADRKKLYKPPTNEELNRLRETENLFHSTLFRLQVKALNDALGIWGELCISVIDYTYTKQEKSIVGKEENAGNQHFLLFSQCFLHFQKQMLLIESGLVSPLQMFLIWILVSLCCGVKG